MSSAILDSSIGPLSGSEPEIDPFALTPELSAELEELEKQLAEWEAIKDDLNPVQLELIDRHSGLVDLLARKVMFWYRLTPDELDDARGIGNEELVRTARAYDPRRESQEATTGGNYFANRIQGAILHGVRTARGRDGDKIANLKPSTEHGTAQSIDTPRHNQEESGPLLGDTLIAPNIRNTDIHLVRADIVRALQTINERDREIFLRDVLVGEPQTEIADDVGLSQPHVSRISRSVAQQLRSELEAH